MHRKSYVPRKAKATYNLGGRSIYFAKLYKKRNKPGAVTFLLQASHFCDELEQVLQAGVQFFPIQNCFQEKEVMYPLSGLKGNVSIYGLFSFC